MPSVLLVIRRTFIPICCAVPAAEASAGPELPPTPGIPNAAKNAASTAHDAARRPRRRLISIYPS